MLLLGPLAFGAVEPWSIFALEACAVLLLAVWAYRQWINRELERLRPPALPPHGGFFALVLCSGWLGTTAYRQVTYSHLLLYAAYGMLAFVVTQTLRRSSQFELMAKLFTAYGAVVAALPCCRAWRPTESSTGSGPWSRAARFTGPMSITIITPA